MARGLCRRIFDHAQAEGWLPPKSIVLDPFAGIGTTACEALLHGCAFVGNELEPRFFQLAQDNIARWLQEYKDLPTFGPWAMVTCGDSRHLTALLPGMAQACIASPPYADRCVNDNQRTIHREGLRQGHNEGDGMTYGSTPGNLASLAVSSPPYSSTTHVNNAPNDMTAGKTVWKDGHDSAARVKQDYSAYVTPGNLANLAVSSPPYAGGCEKLGQIDWSKTHHGSREAAYGSGQGAGVESNTGYGSSPQNLGNLPAGAIECVVSSPPYESAVVKARDSLGEQARRMQKGLPLAGGTLGTMGNGILAQEAYSANPNNLGNEHGLTFWEASKTILEQLMLVLVPGAHCIWVTKRYVSDGQIVDFTDQWIQLCRSVGLKLLHHHRAMLVEHHGTQTDLFQGDAEQKTIKASFFRRLHMKKRPDLAILWEDVTCWVWEGDGGSGDGVQCCVSSPPYSGNDKHDYRLTDVEGYDRDERRGKRQGKGSFRGSETYGRSVGQLGAMPTGDITLVVSSPPYNLPMSQDHNGTRGGQRGTTPSESGAFVKYGNTTGQLEGLPPGDINLVIASPPFHDSTHVNHNPRDMTAGRPEWRGGTESAARVKQDYATMDTLGQLGAMPPGMPPRGDPLPPTPQEGMTHGHV